MDLGLTTIKRGIKKITSRRQLPTNRRGSQESQRNITPPRSTVPDEAFTTPPTTTAAGLGDTPADVVPTTPVTPPFQDIDAQTNTRFSWRKKKQPRPAVQEALIDEPETVTIDLDADLLQPGITGADYTLPLFDGRSDNPVDHIIDLDTDSMERCPDVRVYFWMIGQRVLQHDTWGFDDPETDRPTASTLRLQYDDKVVKMGREYLRMSMIKKEGRYLSPVRDRFAEYLPSRRPDSPWYRFPSLALVKQLLEEARKIDYENKEEGSEEPSFFDNGDDMDILEAVKTNIRVPIIWTQLLKKGVVPGTHGWDVSIMARYDISDHPVCMLLNNGYNDFELLSSMLTTFTGSDGFFPCSYDNAAQVLETDFPYLKEPVSETADRDEGVDYSELYARLNDKEAFFYGRKEYRKKKKLFGIIPLQG